ncbi:MAG TPA: zinc ribbon domain-containing protein [Vicinamibacterales bacterium]|nr:zinc ribbon domain-containing protein [Vicinamibacterales bacterium]
MYCPHCGAPNDDNNFRCTKCGQIVQRVAPAVATTDIGDNAAMRMLLPVGRSGWAIAAGYAGLFALLVVPAPLALLLGIVAVRDLRKRPTKHGMGRAVFGIVMGGLGSGVLLWLPLARA